ncbi:helix-turn-helix domain-containing protein, partial [Bacteroides sp.]|uniref:helix-turn-helix domain-containing protein n=1 Tax=Bacteroides sp. TaxID=29523 RepID=UPI0025840630
EKLFVTPKYLSAICKEISGETASDIITRYVKKDIECLLKQPNKTIKEIANELDFANLSFFGKYVKRIFGVSPKEYRENIKYYF